MIIKENDVHLATNIRDVLNSAGGVVDNDVTSFFKPAAKLNPWSKWKPVKWDALFTKLTFDAGEVPWWQAYDGCCGFISSSITFGDIDALVEAYRSGSTFVYDLPDGDWPKRVGDFRRYNTAAKSPIWSFEISSETGGMFINNYDSSFSFTILGNNDVDTDYNLILQDVAPMNDDIGEYHFGVIIVSNSTGTKSMFTNPNKIEWNKFWERTVKVTLQNLADKSMAYLGDYTVYPVLTDPENRHFMACPIAPLSFSIKNDPTFHKIGWADQSCYYKQIGGSKYFYGTLEYNDKMFEGVEVWIQVAVYKYDGSIEILGSSVITGQGTILKADYVKSGGEGTDNQSNGMYIPPAGESIAFKSSSSGNQQGEDKFYLRCVYWESSGNHTTYTEQLCQNKSDSAPGDELTI